MCIHTNVDVFIFKKYFFRQNFSSWSITYLSNFFFLKTLLRLILHIKYWSTYLYGRNFFSWPHHNPTLTLTLNRKKSHPPEKANMLVTTHFWTNITTGRGKKIWTTAIPHISQEVHEYGKLSGVQIFLVQVTVKKWPHIHYYWSKVLLVSTPLL